MDILQFINKRRYNKNLRLSNKCFENSFNIPSAFFLYEYGGNIENRLYNLFPESKILYKYLDVLILIRCLETLFLSPANENSYENEFTKLYSFFNIININRSYLKGKSALKNKLFYSFLFCSPCSEETIKRFYLGVQNIRYKKEDTTNEFQNILDIIEKQTPINNRTHAIQVNSLLRDTYNYLAGRRMDKIYFGKDDLYSYYFANPADYIQLYINKKNLFYSYLDDCAIYPTSFARKAFIYNYNIFLVKTHDIINELKIMTNNTDSILKILFKSNVTLPNQTIRDIKFRHQKY